MPIRQDSVSMGLAGGRQTAKILTVITVKKREMLPSTVKTAVVTSRQTASWSFKSRYFSSSFRTAGYQ